MIITDSYMILSRHTLQMDNKFKRNTLNLNSLSHKVLNLQFFLRGV